MPARALRHSLAAAAPLLCAIHCVATPLLVAVLPAFAMGHTAELTMFAVTVVLATWAVRSGTVVHRHPGPALVAGLGVSSWGGQLFDALPTFGGELGIALAALFTAAGLVWNARLRHSASAECCDCVSCGHPTPE
jgi:hypothetical protein